MEQYLHPTEKLTDLRNEQKSNPDRIANGLQKPNSELSNKLYRCGHCDVYDYLDNLKLNSLSKSIVLLSSHHYFFKEEDLQEVEMVVDIQNLARRRDIESYLKSIHSNIPDGCYFTGCFETPTSKFSGNPEYHKYLFEYEKELEENRNASGNLLSIIDKLINRLRISLSQNLSITDTEALFIKTGFNVMNLTEKNGRIYFSAIKEPKYNNNYSLS